MQASLETVRFAFQPVFNLRTGGVVAIEVLARVRDSDVHHFLDEARRGDELIETDVALAAAAIDAAAAHETLLPLHVNLLAETVASSPVELAPLREALRRNSRRAKDVIIDVSAPYSNTPPGELVHGLGSLRLDGFRIALDGLGDGDPPLTVLAAASPDLLKIDCEITAGLPDDQGRFALVEALAQLADRIGAAVIAEGVESDEQLAALRQIGVQFAQGNLLAAAARRPAVNATISPAMVLASESKEHTDDGPPLTDYLHPAITLPVDVTAEEVRAALVDQPVATGVVLVDPADRPCWTIDRNRFLLAVTGPFGHALHARREATRLADKPHIIESGASILSVLDVVAGADRQRSGDDIVVVDGDGRCRGIVRVTELVRGIAEQSSGQPQGRHSR